jgi:hypothetical protein
MPHDEPRRRGAVHHLAQGRGQGQVQVERAHVVGDHDMDAAECLVQQRRDRAHHAGELRGHLADVEGPLQACDRFMARVDQRNLDETDAGILRSPSTRDDADLVSRVGEQDRVTGHHPFDTADDGRGSVVDQGDGEPWTLAAIVRGHGRSPKHSASNAVRRCSRTAKEKWRRARA